MDPHRPRRVVLVGGSGFLGRALSERLLQRGDHVTVIGRSSSPLAGVENVAWDGRTSGDWEHSLNGADAIVHLAGKRVDCRPTRSNIDELIASRAGTVELVGTALQRLASPPPLWVQLSSLAIFGDGGETSIDESTPTPTTGARQQVDVCRRWESAFVEATAGCQRTVLVRGGIGIGGSGDPATKQLARLARLYLGGPVAGGQQWISWIGADDFTRVLIRAIDDESMHGTYHATAPEPVRNAELMAAYRAAVGMRHGLPSPAWLTKVGAWALGSDPQLAVTGRRCVPSRLLSEGFVFRQTDLGALVREAVRG